MSVIEIPVGNLLALVSLADAERILRHRWTLTTLKRPGGAGYYATRKLKKAEGNTRTTVYMHRVVARAPRGSVVDHQNGNGLDNRRENLRVCSTQENNSNLKPRHAEHNSSQYKGVSRGEKSTWRARISHNYLGSFGTEEQAARAYDAAARVKYGAFAWLNFK